MNVCRPQETTWWDSRLISAETIKGSKGLVLLEVASARVRRR
jgi:hypothetical protein